MSRVAATAMVPANTESESSASEEESTTDAEAVAGDMAIDANLPLGPVLTSAMEDAMTPKNPKRAEQARAFPCSPNVKALAVSAFLFALITLLQVGAARIAHSQALMTDCISMGVDAFTYMGNIFVECKKRDGGDHVPSQLVVVACSLSLLIFFTVQAAQEAWGTIQVCQGKAPADGDEDDVNGYITLAFALGGMVFDAFCLLAFYRSHKKTGGARAVNMFSALLHVGADCLRSTSTTVMSLLILLGGYDSTCLDAYTSMFIGATIVLGAATGIFSWFKMLLRYCGCMKPKAPKAPKA